MRKRKLYLSEFLKKHEHKYSAQVNIYRYDENFDIEFENFTKALTFVEKYESQNNEVLEIDKWTYNETLGYIIMIK